MSKDPAILFYTSDFLTGTMFLTDEQTGRYIRLLCAQHQKGRLSEKDMINICKSYDKDIFDKFKKDTKGFYFNERLENETEKRRKYSESRRKNRQGKKKDMIKICKTYDKHMENENENENENRIKNENCKLNESVILPFETINFREQWDYWKNYKAKEFNFKYKSVQSEQAALKQLSKLSKNNESIAIEIIHESFANGWKGFFKLNNKNEKQANGDTEKRDQYFREHDPNYKNY